MPDAEKVLEEAREAFDEASEASSENVQAYLDDIRFARLGEQWDDAAKRARGDGRPMLTINRMPAFLRQVVNDARQNRPSVNIKPADSRADPQTAKILRGLIRNIEYTSNADVAYDTAIDCSVTGGFGYWRIDVDYAYADAFDMDIKIERIANPLTVLGDPRSKAADSSDWNVAFETELIEIDDFRERFGKNKDAASWDADGYDGLKGTAWRDGDEIRIAKYWTRELVDTEFVKLSTGAIVESSVLAEQAELFSAAGISVVGSRKSKIHRVKVRLLSGCEVLEEKDWPGCYIPIVPVYGDEVNVEGKRYFRSLIRDAKDAQRMFNYWRTTSTELVALAPRAPWIGPKGFAKSDRRWNTANTQNHPFLEYDGPTPPQRQGFDGPPAGALQEALNASDDMKSIMGLYDASLGARSNETSGRAILARQREGDVSTFHFIDNLSRAIRHTGRILIDLIPKVYTGERIVRVIGEDGSPENVPINQPVQIDGQERIYDLAAGKYDLAVETGPSYTTKREEAAVQMTEFVRAYPPAAQIIGDLIAKNMDWPGSEEIAQRLRAMLPPQLQGQGDPRIQQLMQQLQQGMQAYQALQAENQQLKAQFALKKRETDIKAYSAETDRLQAVSAAVTPEQVQAIVMQTLQQVLGSPDVLPNGAAAPVAQPPMMGA